VIIGALHTNLNNFDHFQYAKWSDYHAVSKKKKKKMGTEKA